MKYFILALVIFFTNLNSWAKKGGDSDHGGDPLSIEVYQAGVQALNLIRARKAEFPEVSIEMLRVALNTTRVDIVNEDLYDKYGVLRPAINNADKKLIKVNRYQWNFLGRDTERKATFALHEYLGILGLEVDNYKISDRLFQGKTAHLEIESSNQEVNSLLEELDVYIGSQENSSETRLKVTEILTKLSALLIEMKDDYEQTVYKTEIAARVIAGYLLKETPKSHWFKKDSVPVRLVSEEQLRGSLSSYSSQKEISQVIVLLDEVSNSDIDRDKGLTCTLSFSNCNREKTVQEISRLRTKMGLSEIKVRSLQNHLLYLTLKDLHNEVVVVQSNKLAQVADWRTEYLPVGGTEYLIED